jgi:hypothetical protein
MIGVSLRMSPVIYSVGDMLTIPYDPVPRGGEVHAVGARCGPILRLEAGLALWVVSLRSSGTIIVEAKRAA